MAAPSITVPTAGDQVFDSTPQIQWNEVTGADSYEIWVSQIGSNAGAVYQESGLPHNRVTVPFELNLQQQRIWVRATDAAGQNSSWSPGRDFTVVNTKPTSLSAYSVTNTSATLSWSSVTGADSYEVWLSQNSGRVQLLSNLTSTSTQVTGLPTAANHTFWVRAIDDGHEISSWSSPKSFTTIGTAFTLARPTGSNPGTVKNTTSARLSWNAIPGADHYEVWLNRSDGTNIFIDTEVNSTVYWADELDPGTSYRYWVRAVDAGGYFSKWSFAQGFHVTSSNFELPYTTHLSTGTHYLNGGYNGFRPNLIIDANSTVTWIAGSNNGPIGPRFGTVVIRSGATVTGQAISTTDIFTLNADTLIIEDGAVFTGDLLTLNTNDTFIGANATLSAGGMLLRGQYVLGDAANLYATSFAFGTASDPIITPGATFADQETTSDADFDDLPDIQEIAAGTLGGSADTDGDWLIDGFEVRNGMDPKTAFGDPLSAGFAWPDADNDGLNLLDEQIFSTNPLLWDSDGDNTSDFDEANNGGNANDHTDLGQTPDAADTVEVTLTVGDHSSSASERYMLAVGDIRHQSEGFGVVSTRTYTFERGTEHEVRLVHIAGNQSDPDYDYSAGIAASSPSMNEDIRVVDLSDLLGVWDEPSPAPNNFRARTLTALLIIPDQAVPVVSGDLDIEGVTDAKELSEGGFVNVNLDDDDNDGTADKDDTNGVQDENDLLKLTFSITTNDTGFGLLRFNGSDIKIWKNANRTNAVFSQLTAFATNTSFTVYAEGVAETEEIVTLVFASSTIAAVDLDAVKVITAESILLAIDGTGSAAWSQDPDFIISFPDGTERTQSHVRNFYDDYASRYKYYQHGPTVHLNEPVGFFPPTYPQTDPEMTALTQASVAAAKAMWLENPNRPIDLVGHSRGGFAAIVASYDISAFQSGIGMSPRIRFVGLYDPVSATNYRPDITALGTTDSENLYVFPFPPQVETTLGVFAAGNSDEVGVASRSVNNVVTERQSRFIFPRTYTAQRDWVFATHSAIGGAPGEGDHLVTEGHSLPNDVLKAPKSDQLIRTAAIAAGLPIKQVPNYGY